MPLVTNEAARRQHSDTPIAKSTHPFPNKEKGCVTGFSLPNKPAKKVPLVLQIQPVLLEPSDGLTVLDESQSLPYTKPTGRDQVRIDILSKRDRGGVDTVAEESN